VFGKKTNVKISSRADIYGGWISPEGKFYEVEPYGHVNFVIDNQDLFGDLGESGKAFVDIEEFAADRGWIRTAIGRDRISFDVQKLNDSVIRKIQNILNKFPRKRFIEIWEIGTDYTILIPYPEFVAAYDVRDIRRSKVAKASLVELDQSKVEKFKNVLIEYIMDLMGDDESYTREDVDRDIGFMLDKVNKENQRAVNTIESAIRNIGNWNGTPVRIAMNWSDPSDSMGGFWDTLMDPYSETKISHSVYVGSADFTLFFDGTIDDILEIGIEEYEPDFFTSNEQKKDYYNLINSLQNKGEEDKKIVLYTGRPVKDREQLTELAQQKKWPRGIWLTDDINLAYSFGADYGEARDVWRVSVMSSNTMYDPSYNISFAHYATPEAIEANADSYWQPILDAAVPLMDDDIRESVHADLAPCSALGFPCSALDFLLEYMERHYQAYGLHFDW